MHDVEAIYDLHLYCKLQFHVHNSYFRRDFQMLLAVKEGEI